MGLKFECSYCHETIFLRYLNVGDNAKCKNCGKTNVVPQDAVPISDEETGNESHIPNNNNSEAIVIQEDHQTQTIQTAGEVATNNTLPEEIEPVDYTDDGSQVEHAPRFWTLIVMFWKHIGVMLIIGLYMLITLPREIIDIQVGGALGRFVALLVLWIPINLIAVLFCSRRQPSPERDKRYRRIVFWGMLVMVILCSLAEVNREINLININHH